MSMKRVLLGLAAFGAVAAASKAQAQNVEFAATTTGCFYNTPATCVPANASNLFNGFVNGGVTFHGDGFDGFSDGAHPNNTLQIPGVFTESFGYFDSGNALHTVGPKTRFDLNVFFTLPTIIGDPNAKFTAVVSGAVTKDKTGKRIGGYDITFNHTPITFTYFGPTFQGSFSLLVNDLHIKAGYSQQFLSGTIVTEAASLTPEPATIALFATGLIGLVPFARRRRKGNNA